jgi:hypothetical protein
VAKDLPVTVQIDAQHVVDRHIVDLATAMLAIRNTK